MTETFVSLAYLTASALFVLAVKWLGHPRSARRGVRAGELGMLLAVVGTLVKAEVVSYQWILVGLVLGSAIGTPMALLMPMTAVPQRTALSHAFGALAVALVGTSEYYLQRAELGPLVMAVLAVEVLLGCLTFTGSLMAFGKLQALLPGRAVLYRGQNLLNLALFGIAVVVAGLLVARPDAAALFPVLVLLALVFGALLVVPIGAADMPTVISLLNAYAGLSASAMGFVLDNQLLIIAGALDGSSGLILSVVMCKAMNRSFANVLFGGFGQAQVAAREGVEDRSARGATPEEAASILGAASSVVVVPGYGMAVAQAQHKVRELYDALTRAGVSVTFAVHPVAGRMPGHMNVLLAEADIPYERFLELDEANAELRRADVALVIGANDVTNPAARDDPGSPIYGMPILEVDQAGTVMVIKRSMSSGFAGIDNELYFMVKTLMLFGDAKSFTADLVRELAADRAWR